MESLRQIGAGFLLAVISLSLVFGGFALSVVEGGGVRNLEPTALPSLPVIETSGPTPVQPTQSTAALDLGTATEAALPSATFEVTGTLPPTPASCLPPAGWVVIVVQSYDTLNTLADTYQTTVASIKDGNCLFSDQLVIGSYLYVPPRPTATQVKCGPPAGWVRYIVVMGDTLYNISLRFRTTVAELQRANCLGSSTYIQAGKPIYVPNVIPSTPVNTPTPPWTATIPPVIQPTATDVPPSDTSVPPTETSVPPSETPVPPTETPVPTETSVPPTETPVTPGG